MAGDTAAIGALLDETDDVTDAGAAYVFAPNSSGEWVEQDKLEADDPGGFARFGVSVAVDGARALIGASTDVTTAGKAGAAYVCAGGGHGPRRRSRG